MRTLLVLLVLTLHAAAASKAPAPPRNDSAIEADIRARLGRSKIGADGFQVRVQGGVATLTGRTDVIQHKGVATRLAKSGGAARVDNRIQISEAAREKAATRLTQARQSHRSVSRSEKTPGAPPPRAAGSQPPPVVAANKTPAATPAAGLAPPPVRRAVVKH